MARHQHIIPLTAALALSATAGTTLAEPADNGAATQAVRYAVTVTNVTRGQAVTPPVVIAHSGGFELFELGQPASDELRALAEDGHTAPLTNVLASDPNVRDFTVGEALMPGQSQTVMVEVNGSRPLISAAAMLASTNDGFFGLHSALAPRFGTRYVMANAYDAGTENNSESCEFIPGPPCGNAGVRDTDGAEGYVHVHAGIHGIAQNGLDPAQHDWRGPVVQISIERLK